MKDDRVGVYVRRVSEETRRYAEELLAENRRLRELGGSLEVQTERLREDLALAQGESAGLRESLRAAQESRADLEHELAAARSALASRERAQARLDHDLARIDKENRRFAEQYAALEEQNSNLANLYVASYRLHETLERATVLTVLQEILANLVGSEEVAIFELPRGARHLKLLASNGIDAERYGAVEVGDGVIGQVVASGEIYIGEPADPHASDGLTACVPLRLADRVSGAIAIFGLLPQKTGICDLDRELFALLATHAATALHCSGAEQGCGQSRSVPGEARPAPEP
jgi:hypothetical protein